MDLKLLYKTKYYIAFAWRSEIGQKRKYDEGSKTKQKKKIRVAFGDTNFNHHRNNESVLTKSKQKILFNIESGKAASKETALFLLHVTDIGNRACEEFI